MKYIKQFNESKLEQTILTTDDVRKLKHNLGGRNGEDFLSNYGWKEDQEFIVVPSGYRKPQTWNGQEITISDLYTKGGRYTSELGYAVLIDGKIEYLIAIYEPHGCIVNVKRGVIIVYGHENIVHLWLDNGEFDKINTR